MRPYAKEYAITTGILQDGRDAAKKAIFGIAVYTVCYTEGVVLAMSTLGHLAELVYTSGEETLAGMTSVVVNEEINWQKKKIKSAFGSVKDRKEY